MSEVPLYSHDLYEALATFGETPERFGTSHTMGLPHGGDTGFVDL